MFKFMKRNKQEQEPESFESLARKASEHEDCFILAAFPKLPGQPDESIIDEAELGQVIFRAVEEYLAGVQYEADFLDAAEQYEEDRASGKIEIWDNQPAYWDNQPA